MQANESIELGYGGSYDGTVLIYRDASGRMLFRDANVDPVPLRGAVGALPSWVGLAFNGTLEVTSAANAANMQKAVYLAGGGTLTRATITGIDGLATAATGSTILTIADAPFGAAPTVTGTVTLASNTAQATAALNLTIGAGAWVYVWISQASGGHYGLQLSLQFV